MAIQKVGVVGCGLMGSGIAQVCAQAGFPTVVREVSPEIVDKGLKSIEKNLARLVEKTAITDAQKMSVGTVGVCQVLNHPETAVQCVVRRIPSTSKEADQTTRIAASLDNVASDQLIEVQMPLQVSKDVLWLPPSAIRTFQNRTFVVVQTADGPRSFDVTLGLQTTDRVEIKSGVNEGDVAIGP